MVDIADDLGKGTEAFSKAGEKGVETGAEKSYNIVDKRAAPPPPALPPAPPAVKPQPVKAEPLREPAHTVHDRRASHQPPIAPPKKTVGAHYQDLKAKAKRLNPFTKKNETTGNAGLVDHWGNEIKPPEKPPIRVRVSNTVDTAKRHGTRLLNTARQGAGKKLAEGSAVLNKPMSLKQGLTAVGATAAAGYVFLGGGVGAPKTHSPYSAEAVRQGGQSVDFLGATAAYGDTPAPKIMRAVDPNSVGILPEVRALVTSHPQFAAPVPTKNNGHTIFSEASAVDKAKGKMFTVALQVVDERSPWKPFQDAVAREVFATDKHYTSPAEVQDAWTKAKMDNVKLAQAAIAATHGTGLQVSGGLGATDGLAQHSPMHRSAASNLVG